jgi:hypothetical protein
LAAWHDSNDKSVNRNLNTEIATETAAESTRNVLMHFHGDKEQGIAKTKWSGPSSDN